MFLNTSQKLVFKKLIRMAEVKFTAHFIEGLTLTPRVLPLLYGPTGAGKTFLAEKLATKLEAQLIKVEVSNWIPEGAREGIHTLEKIKSAISGEGKTLLFIDEIDKLSACDSSWNRGIQAEVWATLDLSKPTRNLLIVAAGTWQTEFTRTSLGFVHQEHSVELKSIPDELRLRFSHYLRVSYPTAAETAALYHATGLAGLAEKVGVTLNPEAHKWDGGMRSLEKLCADLLMLRTKNLTLVQSFLQNLPAYSGGPIDGFHPDELRRVVETEKTWRLLHSKIRRRN